MEGPIVDSFYDMAIILWNIRLRPMLPMVNSEKPPNFADHVAQRNTGKVVNTVQPERYSHLS